MERDDFPLREAVAAYDEWGLDELRMTRKTGDSSWTVVTITEAKLIPDPRARHPDFPGIAIQKKEVNL